MHALHGYEILSALFVSVRVPEDDSGEGRSSAGVVADVLNETSDVAASERGLTLVFR